jgi:hypothetical protein
MQTVHDEAGNDNATSERIEQRLNVLLKGEE